MSQRLCLPFHEWPQHFQSAYDAARFTPEKFSGIQPGAAAHWSPATHRGVIQRVGSWFAFLKRSGEVDFFESLSQSVTEPRLVRYLDELRTRVSSVTLETYIRDLGEALKVMEPGADLTLVEKFVAYLRKTAVPGTDDIAIRVTDERLYTAGIARMQRHAVAARYDVKAAMAFQDGLLMSFAAGRPERRRALVLTEFGRHVVQRGDRYWVTYAAHEIKTRVAVEQPLPKTLTEWLDLWREIVTCLISPGQVGVPVWITRRGKRMSDSWLRCRLIKATQEELNEPITVQQVRRIVATSITRRTRDIAEAQGQLSHSGPRTTRKSYVQVPVEVYTRDISELIRRVREEGLGEEKSDE